MNAKMHPIARSCRHLLAITVALSFTTLSAPADTITLKNRQQLVGEIIEETDSYVRIRMDLGTLKVKRSRILDMYVEGAGALAESKENVVPEIAPAKIAAYNAKIGEDRAARKAAGPKGADLKKLIGQTNDADLKNAAKAIADLGASGADEAYAVLSKHLADKAWQKRNAAVAALAGYGDERGIRRLEELLLQSIDGKEAIPGSILIPSLERANSPTSIPVLARIAQESKNVSDRRSAVWSLGKMGHQTAFPVIVRAAGDESGNVRSASAFALGKLGMKAGTPTLVRLLNDKDDSTRMQAARAMEANPDPRAIRALRDAISDKSSGPSACLALGKLKAKEAIPELASMVNSLDDDHKHIRQQAARALGMIGDPEAIGVLVPHLQDTSGLGHMCAHALSLIVKDGPQSQKPAAWIQWAEQNR